MPADHWAVSAIEECVRWVFLTVSVMASLVGPNHHRAQFAAFIAKVEGYSGDAPQAYTDNTDANAWYYSALNAMAAHQVTAAEGAFRPNDPITRAEITEMMVGALGFYDLGNQLNNIACPFSDVTERKGFITLANDLGLAGGVSDTSFAPNATATREQAAAMLVRLYHSNEQQLDELFGFYAISSASQSSFLSQLDGAGFGWARLTLQDGHALLNTTSANQNEYYIPAGFTQPINQVHSTGRRRFIIGLC